MGGSAAMDKESGHLVDKAEQADAHRGYDPAQASWSQSGKFNRAWLKDGKRLTLLQRSGYATLSILFVAFGLYLLRVFVLSFRSGDNWPVVLIFGGATIFFMLVGVKGLCNVHSSRFDRPVMVHRYPAAVKAFSGLRHGREQGIEISVIVCRVVGYPELSRTRLVISVPVIRPLNLTFSPYRA
jgi:hypothetical protein